MDVVYRDFSKAFDKALHSSLVKGPAEHEMDNWTVRQGENWLDCKAQSVVTTSKELKLQLVAC